MIIVPLMLCVLMPGALAFLSLRLNTSAINGPELIEQILPYYPIPAVFDTTVLPFFMLIPVMVTFVMAANAVAVSPIGFAGSFLVVNGISLALEGVWLGRERHRVRHVHGELTIDIRPDFALLHRALDEPSQELRRSQRESIVRRAKKPSCSPNEPSSSRMESSSMVAARSIR